MMPIGNRPQQPSWLSWTGDASVGIRLFNILTGDGLKYLSFSDIETDGPVYAKRLPYARFHVSSFGIDFI